MKIQSGNVIVASGDVTDGGEFWMCGGCAYPKVICTLVDVDANVGDVFENGQWVTPVVETPRDIKAEIAALEIQVTPRRQREAILGTDNGWLANIDAQISALRAQL